MRRAGDFPVRMGAFKVKWRFTSLHSTIAIWHVRTRRRFKRLPEAA